MTKLLKRLASDRNGATAIEYGLIAAFVALAIAGSLGTIKTGLSDKFSKVSTEVNKSVDAPAAGAGTTPAG